MKFITQSSTTKR